MKTRFLTFNPCALPVAVAMSFLACGNAVAAAKCNKTSSPLSVLATPLIFGVYSPGAGSPTNSNSTITVFCADQSALPGFTLALSTGSSASFNPRTMLFGSNALNYNMYIDSGYSTIWGDGTSGTAVQIYSPSQGLTTISYTDYGQLFPTQFVTAGAYVDTIVVTVTF